MLFLLQYGGTEILISLNKNMRQSNQTWSHGHSRHNPMWRTVAHCAHDVSWMHIATVCFLTYAWWKYIKQIIHVVKHCALWALFDLIVFPHSPISVKHFIQQVICISNRAWSLLRAVFQKAHSPWTEHLWYISLVEPLSWISHQHQHVCAVIRPKVWVGSINVQGKLVSVFGKIKFSVIRSYLLFFCILPIM